MKSAINIILDEGDNHKPQVLFVEIELDDGRSISIGKRIDYDGLTRLRITAEDIVNAQKDADADHLKDLPF